MLAPVAENLLELGAIVSMLDYSKTFLPVHIKDQLPVLRFLWRMMRDLARAKSHSPQGHRSNPPMTCVSSYRPNGV